MHDAMSHDPDAPASIITIGPIPHWEWPDGSRFPVISGGADDPPPGGDPKADPAKGDPDPKADPKADPKTDPDDPDLATLGEAGQKALAAERAARRKAERDAKQAAAELEKLRNATRTEAEKALDAAKAEGRKSALDEANGRILRAEVKAAAAGKLADPADAMRLIDIDQFTVADDGTVDTKAISSAIDELLKAKPYLAAAGKAGPLPGGGAKPSDGVSMNDLIRRAAGVG